MTTEEEKKLEKMFNDFKFLEEFKSEQRHTEEMMEALSTLCVLELVADLFGYEFVLTGEKEQRQYIEYNTYRIEKRNKEKRNG